MSYATLIRQIEAGESLGFVGRARWARHCATAACGSWRLLPFCARATAVWTDQVMCEHLPLPLPIRNPLVVCRAGLRCIVHAVAP